MYNYKNSLNNMYNYKITLNSMYNYKKNTKQYVQ